MKMRNGRKSVITANRILGNKWTLCIIFLLAVFQPKSLLALGDCEALSTVQNDSTSALETCLALHSAGNLAIPRGTFVITRPLLKNRNQNLIGAGSQATILVCKIQNLPCLIAADSSGGPNNYNFSEIRDLTLQGPGASSDSTGVLLGGDPSGRAIGRGAYGDAVNLTNVRITGFAHGVQWGNHAWANKFLHAAIFGNAVGLFVPPGLNDSGEAISITDSNLFNNSASAIDDQSNFEWFIQGTSFDYNNIAIKFLGSSIHAMNCHFEQPRAQVFFEPYGRGTLSIRDAQILIQNATGSDKSILDLWPQSIVLTIDDVTVWSNHPVEYFVHAQGSVNAVVTNLGGNGNGNIRALANVPLKPNPSVPFSQ